MKSEHYIKKVKESKAYRDFIKEDPKAYLCSLFFIRDFVEKKDETQVDFYSPKKKIIFSFKVEKEIKQATNKQAETMTHKKFIPGKLPEKIKLDIDEMRDTLTDEMHNREMAYQIEKVLAFLNIVENRPVWNCTGFLKGLGLLQAHIEDETNTVLFMEKKSLFDMIKFTGKEPVTPGQPIVIPKKEGTVSTVNNITQNLKAAVKRQQEQFKKIEEQKDKKGKKK